MKAEPTIEDRRAGDARRASELRARRRQAGVRQVTFWLMEGDEEAAAAALAPLTDKAWLALYENGAVERRSDPERAAEIRRKLAAETP